LGGKATEEGNVPSVSICHFMPDLSRQGLMVFSTMRKEEKLPPFFLLNRYDAQGVHK
jgi:hypothetical protein